MKLTGMKWKGVKMIGMPSEWYHSYVIFHSTPFQAFSNDEGMTEWGEMRVFSEVEKKSEARKTSHSTVILSFQHHSTLMIWNAPLNDTGMIRNGLWMNESGAVSYKETDYWAPPMYYCSTPIDSMPITRTDLEHHWSLLFAASSMWGGKVCMPLIR